MLDDEAAKEFNDFSQRLKGALHAHWNQQGDGAVVDTMSWGAVCLDFVLSESESDRAMTEEFYRRCPEYEGDLERFVSDDWGEQLEDSRDSRQHTFVLLAWGRSRPRLKLDDYGTGEDLPIHQWQKDNAYQWKKLRDVVFKEFDSTFDHLDIAYCAFGESSDFKFE
jgi:hypothetical protein